MLKNKRFTSIKYFIVLLIFIISGCQEAVPAPVDAALSEETPSAANADEQNVLLTEDPSAATATAVPPGLETLSIWIPETVPTGLRGALKVPDTIQYEGAAELASLKIQLHSAAEAPAYEYQTAWVYALAAPFPTLVDDVSLPALQQAWHGESIEALGGQRLMVSEDTRKVFESVWGEAAGNYVETVEQNVLLSRAWETRSAWAIIPFEDLAPRWKVISVDGMSPLDKGLNVSTYPLAVVFGLFGDEAALSLLRTSSEIQEPIFPAGNREVGKMTLLVMTGTTALARGTAARMEEVGVPYPASDIQEWLWYADLAHISSEVPFYEQCPPALPLRREARFCSDPSYIELLEFSGIDIVELTGNHIMDWGPEAFAYSLDLYEEQGYAYFGGGWDQDAARQPLLIENNGNSLAFIGCSAMGPENTWATEELPGAARCDLEWMQAQIADLRQKGYIPIVAFQHFEVCDYQPQSTQRIDFKAMAEAGAVIVSGSQAHCPQAMTFVGDHFVHYGLGNLFFDQMDSTYERSEFLDRHVFYEGRHISTQLLTAFLEDSARPRPMQPEERQEFLAKIFLESGW